MPAGHVTPSDVLTPDLKGVTPARGAPFPQGPRKEDDMQQDEAALMADIGYLKALVEHTVPLAAVPDGETAKRIRRSAGISRQTAGVLLGCGANTLLRFEASQVRHSRLLEGSEHYRRLLAALMAYIARTDGAEANAIRWNWKPLVPKTTNNKEKVA